MIKLTFTKKTSGKQVVLAGRLATIGVNAGLISILVSAASLIPSTTKDTKDILITLGDALAIGGCSVMAAAAVALLLDK